MAAIEVEVGVGLEEVVEVGAEVSSTCFQDPFPGAYYCVLFSITGAIADLLKVASAGIAVHEEEGVVVVAGLHEVVGVPPEEEGAVESLG